METIENLPGEFFLSILFKLNFFIIQNHLICVLKSKRTVKGENLNDSDLKNRRSFTYTFAYHTINFSVAKNLFWSAKSGVG